MSIPKSQDHCILKALKRMTKKITMAKNHAIIFTNILEASQTNPKHTHLHQAICESSSNQTPSSALPHKCH